MRRLLWRLRPWLLAAPLVVLAAVPTGWWEDAPVLCIFKRFFGFECYGCGLTRSVSSLLHGNVAAAAEYNPLGFLVATVLVLLVAADLGSRCLRRRSWCKF